MQKVDGAMMMELEPQGPGDEDDHERLVAPRGAAIANGVPRPCACAALAVLLAAALWAAVRVGAATPSGAQRLLPVRDVLNASGHADFKTRDTLPGLSALQGLALSPDGQRLLTFHTNGARVFGFRDGAVTGLEQQRLFNLSQDFGKIRELEVTHIGGVDYCTSAEHGDEVWLATHGDGLAGEGALFAVDAQTLAPKPARVAARVAWNLDWVACDSAAGVLYFGEFFNVKLVRRVRLDTLERLEDVPLVFPAGDPRAGYGVQFVQSASFFGPGQIALLGDDYLTTMTVLDAATGRIQPAASQALFGGPESDGLACAPHLGCLVGYNRASHEQTTFNIGQFVSILLYTAQSSSYGG